MIVKEVAEMLVDGGVGTLGIDIFTHFMPYDVDIGVLVLANIAGDAIDYEITGMRRGGFQVIVREPDYDDTLISRISSLLTIQSEVMYGLDIKYMLPKSEPVVYPATDGNNIEYSVNFDAMYAKI